MESSEFGGPTSIREPDPRVAESNLAEELAERMRASFSSNGYLGEVDVDRGLTVAVLVRAMDIFERQWPGSRPVFSKAAPSHEANAGHGRLNFVRDRCCR